MFNILSLSLSVCIFPFHIHTDLNNPSHYIRKKYIYNTLLPLTITILSTSHFISSSSGISSIQSYIYIPNTPTQPITSQPTSSLSIVSHSLLFHFSQRSKHTIPQPPALHRKKRLLSIQNSFFFCDFSSFFLQYYVCVNVFPSISILFSFYIKFNIHVQNYTPNIFRKKIKYFPISL